MVRKNIRATENAAHFLMAKKQSNRGIEQRTGNKTYLSRAHSP
jgi:hypothetical protein